MKNLLVILFIGVLQVGFGQNKDGVKTETILEGVDSIIHSYNPIGQLTETKHYKNKIPFERIEYNYWHNGNLNNIIYYSNIEIWQYKDDSITIIIEDEWGDPTLPSTYYGPVKIDNSNRVVFDTVSSNFESFRYFPNGSIDIISSTANEYRHTDGIYKKENLIFKDSLIVKKELFRCHEEREFRGRFDSITIMTEDEWGDPTIPNTYATPLFYKINVIDSVPSIITTYKYDKESRLIEKQAIVKSNYDGDDEFIKANSEQNYLYQYSYIDRIKNEKILWNGFLKEERTYKDEILIEKVKYLSSSKELKYNYSYQTDKKGNISSVIENSKVIKRIQYEYYPLSNLGGK